MSTRGTFGFIINGKKYAFYSGNDSYLEGLGEYVLNYIKKAGLKSSKAILNRTKDLILRNMDFSSQEVEDLNGAELYELLKRKVGLENAIEFMEDRLFCEYSYLIDLDSGNLNVYQSGDSLVDVIPFNDISKSKVTDIISRMKFVTTEKVLDRETLLYRLEQRDPLKNTNKFYEIILHRDPKNGNFSLETRWGRIGSTEHSKTVMSNENDYPPCLNLATKIKSEKENKGYKLV